MPSLTPEALESATVSTPTRSPSSTCGSCASNDEELEFLGVADTVLADDNWSWLRNLLDPVHDWAVRSQGKVYFARLFKAQDGAEMDTTLSEMETWRDQLGDESARQREHKLARALFLLGYDKNLSLAR